MGVKLQPVGSRQHRSWLDKVRPILHWLSALLMHPVVHGVSSPPISCKCVVLHRLDRVEGQLQQMSDQMRDHAVSMMEAIQQQSTADKIEQSLQGEVGV
jgi:hypothetical protein